MIGFFARHPTAANLLMVIFLAAGLLSLGKLRRETFPDFATSELQIRVLYPGATAVEVEEVVCQRVEDALDSVRFIKELIADAREGVAIITVEMEDQGNFLIFKDEVETEIKAIDDFPAQVETPIITQLHTTDPVMSLLVTGPMAAVDLKAYCEDVKDRLQQLAEVSIVQLQGFSDHQFRVELSEEALRRYGLSVTHVADIIRRQSVNMPAGTIETRNQDILIRFVEERRSPNEIEDLVIVAAPGGGEIRLKDLGTVSDRFELAEDKIFLGNRRAGLLKIQMTKNQDVIRVANVVEQFVQRECQQHPQVTITVNQNTSTLVRDRLQLLLRNGVQGMVLVFLAMWLFFNFRLSFWVVMSLPVSFLGAFFFMPEMHLTVNMLTMAGFLIALGLLMDDGIVIAENIATHMARGKSAMQAAIDGISEVKAGVFSSFITTICVLGPLAFIEGNIGKVLKVVPMILILVLAVSLIEAFMILPAHLAHSAPRKAADNSGGFRHRLDALVDWTREHVLGRTIDVLLHWRYAWIGTVIMVLLGSISLMVGGLVEFQPFPDIEGDTIVARVLLPQGTPLHRTEQVLDRIRNGLEDVNQQFTPLQPGRQPLVETVFTQLNQNTDAFENGPHVATITVDLLTAEKRNAPIEDILLAWRGAVGQIPDVIGLDYSEPFFGPAGRAIEIRFQGKDLQQLKAIAGRVEHWLAEFNGVYNVSDDLRVGKREMRVRLRQGAFGLGLDADMMASQLRAAFHGVIADEIQVRNEAYEIDVQLRPSDQDTLSDLESFSFTLPDKQQVPLSAVADLTSGRGWSRIARIDGARTVSVRGDVDPRKIHTSKLIALMEKELLPKLLPKSGAVRVSYDGEIKQSGITAASMRRAMLIGMLGVFILLSFQFRSYIEPLIVMVAIPLAAIGVVWGHVLLRQDFSMPSALGFISLAGIVVNDSILLVLFLKMQRRTGQSVWQSAAQASRQRFRAITITSLTTIAGLLPLLAERSPQAQVLIPLAISIAFGLMTSTVLVLLVVPCLYVILDDFGLVTRLDQEDQH